ncbi:MAG: Hint domain-containing protein [bacterium]|nr:Hint domain-containing protein [bacterium]MDY4108782.1 Hint domain-containing protein [Bacilli bacterium]
MARSSSVIRADIAATNAELQKVLKEIEACTKLIAKLSKISSDVTYCTSNLSLVLESLELGLTDNDVPVGGEQIEERKNKLTTFNQTTKNAIAKVQKRLNVLQEKASQLRSKLAALEAELAEALAEEAAAAAAQSGGGYKAGSAAQASAARNSVVACFKKGVKVLTNYGYLDIDNIKVNDLVMSYNFDTNSNEYSKVIKTFEHKDINDDLYTITCGSIVIEATSMHPICVSLNNTLGFINAKDLKIGNRLVDYEGNIHEITSITCESVTDTFYNIEVENNHNYYVTENNILVHNKR